jgi:hypothetical protein
MALFTLASLNVGAIYMIAFNCCHAAQGAKSSSLVIENDKPKVNLH